MILHTVNKSSFSTQALSACLALMGDDDALLLIEDGVYCALQQGPHRDSLIQLAHSQRLYALLPDILSRGVQAQLIDGVHSIGYDQFVELATRYHSVQSWY